ncbi:hypothetical protein GCM10012275_54020 [Longimycelium tulufanense]|uniref:Uncharacterized protein n=1 Tax=Longimycelium tulufanense TaxID=907463 RepID=A0A8J3CD91_9PSEU|nr:hypothetical protein [Longimycelium tulufanense]GGM76423.1 hypothetical protein GCM10012275_54020 [Longimycelium tulufanense]
MTPPSRAPRESRAPEATAYLAAGQALSALRLRGTWVLQPLPHRAHDCALVIELGYRAHTALMPAAREPS